MTTIEEQYEKLPVEFQTFMHHTRRLHFGDIPNYSMSSSSLPASPLWYVDATMRHSIQMSNVCNSDSSHGLQQPQWGSWVSSTGSNPRNRESDWRLSFNNWLVRHLPNIDSTTSTSKLLPPSCESQLRSGIETALHRQVSANKGRYCDRHLLYKIWTWGWSQLLGPCSHWFWLFFTKYDRFLVKMSRAIVYRHRLRRRMPPKCQ